MARPSIVTSDPEKAQVIASLIAKGIPQALIARAYNIPDSTLVNWKKRKDFGNMLASEIVSVGASQIDKIINSKHYKSAQIWLERHPDFKEQWAAPYTQPGDTAGNLLDSLANLAKAIAAPRQPKEIKGTIEVKALPCGEEEDEG